MRNTRWLMLRWNSFVQLLLYFCIPGTVREVMPFPFVLSLQLIPSIPPSKHLRHLLTARNRARIAQNQTIRGAMKWGY